MVSQFTGKFAGHIQNQGGELRYPFIRHTKDGSGNTDGVFRTSGIIGNCCGQTADSQFILLIVQRIAPDTYLCQIF